MITLIHHDEKTHHHSLNYYAKGYCEHLKHAQSTLLVFYIICSDFRWLTNTQRLISSFFGVWSHFWKLVTSQMAAIIQC